MVSLSNHGQYRFSATRISEAHPASLQAALTVIHCLAALNCNLNASRRAAIPCSILNAVSAQWPRLRWESGKALMKDSPAPPRFGAWSPISGSGSSRAGASCFPRSMLWLSLPPDWLEGGAAPGDAILKLMAADFTNKSKSLAIRLNCAICIPASSAWKRKF